jgi:hypothetical protein
MTSLESKEFLRDKDWTGPVVFVNWDGKTHDFSFHHSTQPHNHYVKEGARVLDMYFPSVLMVLILEHLYSSIRSIIEDDVPIGKWVPLDFTLKESFTREGLENHALSIHDKENYLMWMRGKFIEVFESEIEGLYGDIKKMREFLSKDYRSLNVGDNILNKYVLGYNSSKFIKDTALFKKIEDKLYMNLLDKQDKESIDIVIRQEKSNLEISNLYRKPGKKLRKHLLKSVLSIRYDDPTRKLIYQAINMWSLSLFQNWHDANYLSRLHNNNDYLLYHRCAHEFLHSFGHSVLIGNDIPILKFCRRVMGSLKLHFHKMRKYHRPHWNILKRLYAILEKGTTPKIKNNNVHWSLFYKGKIDPSRFAPHDPRLLFLRGTDRAELHHKEKKRVCTFFIRNKEYFPVVPRFYKKISINGSKQLFPNRTWDDTKVNIFTLDPSLDAKEVQIDLKKMDTIMNLDISEYFLSLKSLKEYLIFIEREDIADSPAFAHLIQGNPDFDIFIQNLAIEYKN